MEIIGKEQKPDFINDKNPEELKDKKVLFKIKQQELKEKLEKKEVLKNEANELKN